MRRFLLCLAFLLTLSFTSFAQLSPADAPATREDVEKYLEVMHAREMMHQMSDAMAKPMHQMVHDQFMKDKDRLPPDFEAHMNQYLDDMMKDMPWDQMLDAMIPAYQKHFTKGDFNALIAFYSTPTGQKILRELPAITTEAMQNMMPILRERMDVMTTRMQQEVAQMVQNSKTKPANQ